MLSDGNFKKKCIENWIRTFSLCTLLLLGHSKVYIDSHESLLSMLFRCNPNYSGSRCQNCTNCNCPSGQIQCKVGAWSCANPSDICSKQVDCGLSPTDFVKLCKGERLRGSDTFKQVADFSS